MFIVEQAPVYSVLQLEIAQRTRSCEKEREFYQGRRLRIHQVASTIDRYYSRFNEIYRATSNLSIPRPFSRQT